MFVYAAFRGGAAYYGGEVKPRLSEIFAKHKCTEEEMHDQYWLRNILKTNYEEEEGSGMYVPDNYGGRGGWRIFNTHFPHLMEARASYVKTDEVFITGFFESWKVRLICEM